MLIFTLFPPLFLHYKPFVQDMEAFSRPATSNIAKYLNMNNEIIVLKNIFYENVNDKHKLNWNNIKIIKKK